MEDIVVSIGGSILITDDNDDRFIRALSSLLIELSRGRKLYIVTGGGALARKYIKIAKDLGGNETYFDEIGILATRMNARILITGVGRIAYPRPAESIEEALIAGDSYGLVIMGGTHPGQTTDAVSAMVCERISAARLVNATSVDGVYTSDPKKDPTAKRLPRLTPEELLDIVYKTQTEAGLHVVIDPLAAKIIARSGIRTNVVYGRNLDALRGAIIGGEFFGSIIAPKGT